MININDFVEESMMTLFLVGAAFENKAALCTTQQKRGLCNLAHWKCPHLYGCPAIKVGATKHFQFFQHLINLGYDFQPDYNELHPMPYGLGYFHRSLAQAILFSPPEKPSLSQLPLYPSLQQDLWFLLPYCHHLIHGAT